MLLFPVIKDNTAVFVFLFSGLKKMFLISNLYLVSIWLIVVYV